MKAVLHLKFIVLYIIFGFLCVFTTATLTTELITERLEIDTSQTLYREATMIADNYLPSYFSNESSSWAVHSQLSAMKTYLNSSLWFVEKDGTMITSANLKDTTAPQSVNNFDPAEIGNNQYMIGTYHNYFQEDMITVMAPVTQERRTNYKGRPSAGITSRKSGISNTCCSDYEWQVCECCSALSPGTGVFPLWS